MPQEEEIVNYLVEMPQRLASSGVKVLKVAPCFAVNKTAVKACRQQIERFGIQLWKFLFCYLGDFSVGPRLQLDAVHVHAGVLEYVLELLSD